MEIAQLTYYSLPLINVPKIHTDLLWDLTMLFCGLGVLYFAFVFFFRNKLSKRSANVAQRKRELAPMISNFLFFGEDATKEEANDYINLKVEIRELLKQKFNRKILTEVLLDLQKDVSGDARTRLFRLYTDLGLHLDAFQKLKSWRWEVVSQGILELTKMQVEEAYGFIKKFINDRRGVIRKQAQIATVTLKNEGISYFLDTTKYSISEWQQLKLLDVIRNLEDFDPPKFKAWLTSKNKHVVLFSLRLIKYYNQNDASSSIIQLVKHKDNQIKTEAIHCIKEFCFFDALETLKNVFWKCNNDIKILILDTLAELGGQEEIAFLKLVETKESNFNVKSKALSAINTISPESIMPKDNIDESLAEANWHEDLQIIENTADVSEESTDMPLEWVDALDQEKEDEAIFELCVMEELEDMLSEPISPDDHLLGKVEFLPLDFLPIVAENEILPDADDDNVVLNEDILSMDVDAEEVENDSFNIELTTILERLNQSDEPLTETEEGIIPDFLPIVTDMEEELASPTEENDEFLRQEEIGAIEVVYEEVVFAPKPKIEESISGIEVIYEEVFGVPVPNTNTEISVMEVAYEEVPYTLANEKEEEIAFENIEPSILDPDIFVPSDWTEIDKDEKKSGIESKENKKNPTPKFTIMEQKILNGFSIFEELFRSYDAESKLILMDEILPVGDEKELLFLDTLLEDPDKRIAEKAARIQEQLRMKLAQNKDRTIPIEDILGDKKVDPESHDPIHEEDALKPLEDCFLSDEAETDPQNSNGVFDVNFELEHDTAEKVPEEENKKETDGEQSSLLGSILSFPVKILDKFNG